MERAFKIGDKIIFNEDITDWLNVTGNPDADMSPVLAGTEGVISKINDEYVSININGRLICTGIENIDFAD